MINSKRKHRTSWPRFFSKIFFWDLVYSLFFLDLFRIVLQILRESCFLKNHRIASTSRSRFLIKSFGGDFWKAEAVIGRCFWNSCCEIAEKWLRGLLEAFLVRFRCDRRFSGYIMKCFRPAVFHNTSVQENLQRQKF